MSRESLPRRNLIAKKSALVVMTRDAPIVADKLPLSHEHASISRFTGIAGTKRAYDGIKGQ